MSFEPDSDHKKAEEQLKQVEEAIFRELSEVYLQWFHIINDRPDMERKSEG